MSLQADVSNLLVIHPRDIYGNEIVGIENLQFTAVLNDSLNILQVESTYNKVLRRYEIFIVPNISYSEAQLNITSEDIHIFGSPFLVNIRPGPYSL
jgi:hypothetical protein